MKITNKEYLKLAIPFILSTITQPLLGAVDTAVVGHLDDPRFIGGVSVGAVIFATIYWMFGFLRVTTTGLSAKAYGANDYRESTIAFFRPLMVAILVGVSFILLQTPIYNGFIKMLSPEEGLALYIAKYYKVLIYGAPFVLVNYTILGWLMGRGLLKESLTTQIGGNLLNIGLDFLFVFYLKLDVTGVAIATLISQIMTTLVGIYFIKREDSFDKSQINRKVLCNKSALINMARDNINFMIRTTCLLIQANIFTATSASFGTTTLAGNAILLQILYFMSYSFDGLANAASVFAGKSLGKRDIALLDETWKVTVKFIGIFIVGMTILNIMFIEDIIGVFTNLVEVKRSAMDYKVWMCVFPALSGFGLAIYGIFTGTMTIESVRNSTVMALVLYLITWKISIPLLGNNGLWLSLVTFYFGRSLFFIPMKKNVYKKFQLKDKEVVI